MRHRRRFFRWRTLLVAVAALIVLIFLGLIALQTPWVKSYVLGEIRDLVERESGLRLSVRQWAWNPFALRVSFRGLRLERAAGGLPPFLEAEALVVRASPALVLRKEIRFRDISLERTRVVIAYGPDGSSNLPVFAVNPASPPLVRLPPFVLEHGRLTEAGFSLDDPRSGRRVELAGIEIDLRWAGGETHVITLGSSAPGLIHSGRLRLPLDALHLDASFDRDSADVRELSAASGASRVSLAGRIADLFSPHFDARLDADVTGPDLRDDLSIPGPVTGKVSLRATLGGTAGTLSAKGVLEGAGVGFGEWTDAAVRAEFAYSPSGLDLPVLKVTSPLGGLSGEAAWKPGPGGGTGRVRADWSGVNPGRFIPSLGRPGGIMTVSAGAVRAHWDGPLPASLEARAEISFRAPAEALDPTRRGGAARVLTGELRADVKPARPAAGGASSLADVRGRLALSGFGDVRLDGAAALGPGWADLKSFEALFPGGSLTASGRLPWKPEGGKLAISLKAPEIDLGRTAGFLGLAVPLAGKISVEASASGTVAEPAFSARATATGLDYGANPIGAASLRLETVRGHLSFGLSVPSFGTTANGSVDLAAPYRTRGTLAVKALDLRRLFPAGGAPPSFEGRATAQIRLGLDLAAAGRTVSLEAEITELLLGIRGIDLANRAPIKTSFDGRELKVQDLTLSGTAGSIEISGRIPVSAPGEGRMDVWAAVDLAVSSAFEKTVAAEGRAEITATLTGTLASPLFEAQATASGVRLDPGHGVPAAEDLDLAIDVRNGRIELGRASFRWGRASASLSGILPLSLLGPRFGRAPSAFTLKGTVSGLDPSEIASALSEQAPKSLGGEASFGFDLHGSGLGWKGLAGQAVFSSLSLSEAGSSVSLRGPAVLSLDRGVVRVSRLELAGTGTDFTLDGAVDLAGRRIPGLSLQGSLELALMRRTIGLGSMSGRSTIDLRASGDLSRPRVEGRIGFREVALRMPAYDLSLAGLSGDLEIEGETLTLRGVKGTANRGTIELSGGFRMNGLSLASADIRLGAVSVLTSYPEGAQAEWNLDLGFALQGGRPRIAGKASMVQGEYTRDFILGTGILGLLRSGGVRVYEPRSPFLEHLAFDVDIVTANPFSVRNNIADAQVRAALKLGGTPYDPGLGGSLLVLDGGTVTLSGNTYQVERGRVDFVNPNRIEPNLDIQASTTVSGYAIRLTITGKPEDLRAIFTSDPPLSEADILGLLTVGVPLQRAAPSSVGLKAQALSYLEGALTGRVGKRIARGLGLETLTLDTNLVAPGDTPEARLTAGQHLTPGLQLILSQDLRDANVRTVILNYSPRPKVNVQALNTDSNTYRFSAQGRFRFGPSTPVPASLRPAPEDRLRIGAIRFAGEPGFPEKTLRKRLGLKTGRRFSFLAYGRALRKLEEFYRRSGRLDGVIDPRRETSDGRIDLTFEIRAGPRYELVGRGWSLSRGLRRQLERKWSEESFAELRTADVARTVEAALCAKRYFRARVAAHVEEAAGDTRRVVIDVRRGTRFGKPRIIFRGNTAFGDRRLRAIAGAERLCADVFEEPRRSAELLRDHYRANGYLSVRVADPRVEFDEPSSSVRIAFEISEGPLFRVRAVRFAGAAAMDDEHLRKTVRLAKGSVFRLEGFDRARSRLQDAYEAKGFIDASVKAEARPDPQASAVDLEFRIDEGRQAKIAGIEISGNKTTKASFVREVLAVRPGDLVDHRKLNESRRNLYGLGVFRTLDIDLAPAANAEKEAAAPSLETGPRPYRVKIDLSEDPPFSVVGGLQYDTEKSAGGNATLIYENLLGRALSLGASGLYDRLERSARVFLRSQYLLGDWADTNLSVYYDRSVEPDFTVRKTGVSLQQQRRFGPKLVLTGAYTFERDRTTMLDGSADERRNIGRLSLSLAYDSRDDFLNPSKGHFLSEAVEYGDRFLGSGVRYVRSYSQASLYIRLAPFLLFASGARLGLGTGFGAPLPAELRFLAGGGTTVRGYAFQSLGPKNPATGHATGGDALLVLNEELRFPVYKILGGVAFLDLGNVYPSVGRLKPWSLRAGVGFGLRLSLGALVGRFDVGFNPAPRPGESRSAIYFSIGQIF